MAFAFAGGMLCPASRRTGVCTLTLPLTRLGLAMLLRTPAAGVFLAIPVLFAISSAGMLFAVFLILASAACLLGGFRSLLFAGARMGRFRLLACSFAFGMGMGFGFLNRGCLLRCGIIRGSGKTGRGDGGNQQEQRRSDK